MIRENGGEDGLAPVIPLFGAKTAGRDASGARPAESAPDAGGAADHGRPIPRRTGDEGLWRSAWTDDPDADPDEDVEHGPAVTHPASAAAQRCAASAPRLRALGPHEGARRGPSSEQEPDDEDTEALRERAQEALVRRLRSRQLSVAEARTVLREQDLDREGADGIIEDFTARGYLDDRTLATLLVTSGAERKGQGRVALSRSLAQRGIPREVIDEALAELPDDDAERALEYARSKAQGMSRLDPDTALRRLLGQLARRGYGGSVAMNAARTALREAGAPRSGVRFVDSE